MRLRLFNLYLGSYCLISLLMWYMSPSIYSHSYCTVLFCLMLLYAIPFLAHKIHKYSFLNFDTIFFFSYISINYLHAVFIYPDDSFLPAFSFDYNSNNITPGVALASVGIAFYMFGSTLFEKVFVSHIPPKKMIVNERLVSVTEKTTLFISVCVFLYVFVILGATAGALHHLPGRLMAVVGAIFALSFYYKAEYLSQQQDLKGMKMFVKNNKLHIVAVCLFGIAQLRLGSRGGILSIILFLLFIVYRYYFKIKVRYIVLFGLIGVILMSVVTLTRTSAINLTNSSVTDVVVFGFEQLSDNKDAIWLLFLDLVVNARTLYESIEFVPQCGLLYGVSYVPQLFCFIPGGGSLVSQLFWGKLPVEMNSGGILTDFANAPYGLGTNMIADLYINYALIGVVLMTFLLGVLINYSAQCNTKYKLMLYGSFFSQAIFLPRAIFLMWTDLFVILVLLDLTLRAMTRYRIIFFVPHLKIKVFNKVLFKL